LDVLGVIYIDVKSQCLISTVNVIYVAACNWLNVPWKVTYTTRVFINIPYLLYLWIYYNTHEFWETECHALFELRTTGLPFREFKYP